MTILTGSEISSLDSSLWWWEFGEYVSEAIVILGCAGEFIAEFTSRLTGGDETKKHRLSKFSLLILIAGLATGLLCLMRATVVSGRIIASLNEEAGEARLESGRANERAANAELQTTTLRVAMADRNLSPEQQRAIRDACLASPWKGRDVWLRSYPNDGEAGRLIVEIKAAFEPCLIVEDRTGQALTGTGTVVGMRIDPAERGRDFAAWLINTLSDPKMGNQSVDALTPFGSVDETTEIMVGLKPATLTQFVSQIQKRQIGRILAGQEQEEICTALKRFSGQKYTYMLYTSDPEATRFAEEIFTSLKCAGWKEVDPGVLIELGVTGISVEPGLGSEARSVALISLLTKFGFPPKGRAPSNTGDPNENTVRITIGRNP